MAEPVCDKVECPLYGYYHDMAKFPKLSKIKKEIKDGYFEDYDNMEEMSSTLNRQYIVIYLDLMTRCANCCNFKKPDMSTYWTTEEAKKLLLKK